MNAETRLHIEMPRQQSRPDSCLDGCCGCFSVLSACCRMLCCLGPVERPTTTSDTNPTAGLLNYQAPSPATTQGAPTEPDTPSSTRGEQMRLLPKGYTPSHAPRGPSGNSAPGAAAAAPTHEAPCKASKGDAHGGPDKNLLSEFEAQRARLREKLGAGLSLEDFDEEVCPTCLDPYTEDNPRIVTTCQHHFHLACIYEWMERSQTCPMCGKSMQFSELM